MGIRSSICQKKQKPWTNKTPCPIPLYTTEIPNPSRTKKAPGFLFPECVFGLWGWFHLLSCWFLLACFSLILAFCIFISFHVGFVVAFLSMFGHLCLHFVYLVSSFFSLYRVLSCFPKTFVVLAFSISHVLRLLCLCFACYLPIFLFRVYYRLCCFYFAAVPFGSAYWLGRPVGLACLVCWSAHG